MQNARWLALLVLFLVRGCSRGQITMHTALSTQYHDMDLFPMRALLVVVAAVLAGTLHRHLVSKYRPGNTDPHWRHARLPSTDKVCRPDMQRAACPHLLAALSLWYRFIEVQLFAGQHGSSRPWRCQRRGGGAVCAPLASRAQCAVQRLCVHGAWLHLAQQVLCQCSSAPERKGLHSCRA